MTFFGPSIWHKGSVPLSERKFRNLKRIYLPAYDVAAFITGLLAFHYGSRLLHRILGDQLVDAVGLLYALVAAVCFVGVAFPRLWVVEAIGKIILVGLLVSYMATLANFPLPGDPPNWFIIGMLSGLLPMPLFRLSLLGEEATTRWLGRRPGRIAS